MEIRLYGRPYDRCLYAGGRQSRRRAIARQLWLTGWDIAPAIPAQSGRVASAASNLTLRPMPRATSPFSVLRWHVVLGAENDLPRTLDPAKDRARRVIL